MKNIKNYLLSFILGGIIFYSISVFAEYIVTADKIEYSTNVSVKDKIDDLYTKVKPTYTGVTTYTPDANGKTFETAGKILNSNIVIDPISTNLKDIHDSTVTSNSDVALGKVAYKSDGTKLTGTLEAYSAVTTTTYASGVITKTGAGTFWTQQISVGKNVRKVIIYIDEASTYAVDKPTVEGSIVSSSDINMVSVHHLITGYTSGVYKVEITTTRQAGTISINANCKGDTNPRYHEANMVVIYN